MESSWMAFKDSAPELMELQGLGVTYTVHFLSIHV